MIADFFREGAFLRHLRRIRRSYLVARDALVESIERHFPGGVLSGMECGMHLMWILPDNLPSAAEIHRLAKTCGVGLYPFSSAAAHEYGAVTRFRDRAIVLGYTGLSDDEIRQAFDRLATLIPVNGSMPL